MENGGVLSHEAQNGMAKLSMAPNATPVPNSAEARENGGEGMQNGTIVAVGEARTVLPAPDLSGVKSVETHTKALGVIQPPPDLKAIVDKTASFVAKNGSSFEAKILEQQKNNPRFNFLRAQDVYHAYFKHAVARELRIAAGDAPSTVVQQAQEAADLAQQAAPAPVQSSTLAKPLTPPEPDQYTVRTPEGLNGEHVDIIKLTAQCVARNGQGFLAGLAQREAGNSTFLFLKPTHSLHGYFQELIQAYQKTLMPDKALMAKLEKDINDRQGILERCLNRLQWEKNKEEQDRAANDKATAERIAMQSIDWHDFTVVETIDFYDDEDAELPAPMTQKDVVLLNRANAFRDEGGEDAEEPGPQENGAEDVEMDEDEKAMVEEGNTAEGQDEPMAPQEAQVRVEADDDEPMRIVRDYQRPSARATGQGTAGMAVSPITGELVPLTEMAEHMRISLIDPQWKTQREAMMAKIRETTQASDDEISKNLVDLAGHRPDVFGSNEEEVGAIVKASLDEKKTTGNDRAIVWDGQTTGGSVLHNQLNAISDNKAESNKRKEPDHPSMPTPILGPRPNMLANNLPPPPGQGGTLPGPPQVIRGPPPPVNMAPPMRPTQLPPPVLAPPPVVRLAPPPLAPVPPPPTMSSQPPVPTGQPEAKRQRIDFVLQNEAEFLQQHPGPSKVRILCPEDSDSPGLNGQVLEVEVASLSTSIGDLKQRLADVLSLPANKQQLSREHFRNLKDIDTLAYYNVSSDVELVLGVRRRGGR